MANSTLNVVAGHPLATGGVLKAPTGTALPTDVATALNAAFKSVGYIASDGVEQTVARDTDTIRAWGTDIVKVTQTSYGVSFQMTFIEALNAEAAKAAFNTANVTVTAATVSAGNLLAVKLNSTSLEHFSWVFEVRDGDAKVRIVVPDGQITEVGQVKYADGDVIGYQVTITAYPNSSGDSAYVYTDDGQTV